MKFSVVALASIMTMTSPALAGWQWTEWGMTQEEVLSGAGDKSVEISVSTDRFWVLTTTHEAVGHTFAVELWGYNVADGLMMVRLITEDEAACDAVRAGLSERYGDPFALDVWATGEENIQVRNYTNIDCYVTFHGLAPARTDGL